VLTTVPAYDPLSIRVPDEDKATVDMPLLREYTHPPFGTRWDVLGNYLKYSFIGLNYPVANLLGSPFYVQARCYPSVSTITSSLSADLVSPSDCCIYPRVELGTLRAYAPPRDLLP
jgi:hypothetical protein